MFINLWDTMIRNNCRNTASYFLSRENTVFQIKGKFLLHHTELKLDSTKIAEITNEKKVSVEFEILYMLQKSFHFNIRTLIECSLSATFTFTFPSVFSFNKIVFMLHITYNTESKYTGLWSDCSGFVTMTNS